MAPVDFMTEWRAKIAALKFGTLPIKFEPNEYREHLSCLLCHVGADERFDPPEYVVSFRTSRESVAAGLHANCLERNLPKEK